MSAGMALMLVAAVAFGGGPSPPTASPAPAAGTGTGTDAGYDWPVGGRPLVTREFDRPEHNWLPGHRGVDLAASEGDPVHAAAAGVVVFAGSVAGKPVVSVAHEGGLRTSYEPVEAGVSEGQRVARGDVIGTVTAGHSECTAATGACLHWGLRRGREYLDPVMTVGARRVRLVPTVP